MDDTEGVNLPPKASAMIEAMRDIGYSFEAAVADIIDNSITAQAPCIDIRFGWTDGLPWITVVDDGRAMSRDELLEAMRPGSRSPLLARSKDDLGRFGLGMKTASFSQCRELTVVSRKGGSTSAFCWDLDLVSRTDEWRLLEPDAGGIASLPAIDSLGVHGTLVVWRRIDRLELTGTGAQGHDVLNELMGTVREHVARVFHRFLAGEAGHRKLCIRLNANDIEPFDPFNERNRATDILPEERVRVKGGEVVIQPFILPHHSKVSVREYERMAGSEGYLKNQGFYVYRNRRLIIWGTWFRLARQEELTKLARVRIDIPNTLDLQWGIDVRKSRAQPPNAVRVRLRQIVEQIRGSAKRPYVTRGKIVTEGSAAPVWARLMFNDRVEYAVNQEHPIVSDLLTDLEATTRLRVQKILQMVAQSFPAAAFFGDYAGEPRKVEPEAPDMTLLADLAKLVLAANPGASRQMLMQLISQMDPFARWPKALDGVVQAAFE